MKDIFSRLSGFIINMNAPPDDEDEDEEEDDFNAEAADEKEAARNEVPRYIERGETSKVYKGNVVKFTKEYQTQKSVEITDPQSVNDASRIADFLIQGVIVTVNLELTDNTQQQRIADFLSGAAYATKSTIRRLSNSIFIITPQDVNVTGGRAADGEIETYGGYASSVR